VCVAADCALLLQNFLNGRVALDAPDPTLEDLCSTKSALSCIKKSDASRNTGYAVENSVRFRSFMEIAMSEKPTDDPAHLLALSVYAPIAHRLGFLKNVKSAGGRSLAVPYSMLVYMQHIFNSVSRTRARIGTRSMRDAARRWHVHSQKLTCCRPILTREC
jgi:hypothetical protein